MFLRWLLLGWIAVTAGAAEFYVSPRGRDDGLGDSPRSAWRTLDRVNRHIAESGLGPGDRILLRGGSAFDGHLVIHGAGGGTRERPAEIATFGSGRATLRCGPHTGILVRETPWIVVSNLVLQAGPRNDGNTIIAPRDAIVAVRITGHAVQALIRSNLVMAPPGGVLVAISGFGHRLRFENNVHWREDAVPVFLIDAQWPIPSLESWRNSTGPDFRFTAKGDRFTDPGFRGRMPTGISRRSAEPRWPEFTVTPGLAAGAPRIRPEPPEAP